MRRFLTRTGLAVAAVVLGLFGHVATAQAQFVQVFSPPVVVAPAPVVSFSPPLATFSPPPVTTSFYAPAVSYSYYPPTTVFSAPAAVAAPAVVAPGTVTTRTFVGYGIFRPRGVYTQSFYTPGAVVAPTTTFYTPVFWR
jgi:hypothetical protein